MSEEVQDEYDHAGIKHMKHLADVEPDYVSEENVLQEVHEEPTQVPQEDIVLTDTRRSTRNKQTSTWIKDFVSLNINKDVQHSMCSYMSYAHLSHTYQYYISTISRNLLLIQRLSRIKGGGCYAD